MARQQGININTVLLISGAILFWPVIKGIFSLASFTGGILSAPGKFAEAMDKETDASIINAIYSTLMDMAKKTTYNASNETQAILMRELQNKNDTRARAVIAEWIRTKGGGVVMIGQMAAISAAIKKVNQYLSKWF